MTIHTQPRFDPSIGDDASGLLLAAALAEVRATATQAQERGFLNAVGHRLAAACPLTGLVNLDALAEGMNRMLRRLDLGQVRLAADNTGITIEHRGHGASAAGDADPAILEGLYAGWFAELGNDRLRLKLLTASNDRLGFHYGR